MELHIGDTFLDISAAKLAIQTFVANNKETSKTLHSDKTRISLGCKESTCEFRIWAIDSKRRGVYITHLTPHTCNPATYYIAPNTNSLQFLLPHHRASVADNPKITTKQIQSNERLQYSNTIPYLQAYRVREALLEEIWGNESESFALFPDYITRFRKANLRNFAQLESGSHGVFEAAFLHLLGYEKLETT